MKFSKAKPKHDGEPQIDIAFLSVATRAFRRWQQGGGGWPAESYRALIAERKLRDTEKCTTGIRRSTNTSSTRCISGAAAIHDGAPAGAGTQQYLPPEQLRDIQFFALQKLLRHAVDTVPYYRDLFAAQNLRPDDIRSVADLVRVPVLTKALMQQNLERMKSTNYSADQLMEDASGGSTGKNTVFFKD